MIRTIITPENTDIHLSIPDNYVGRKVEVLMYAMDEPMEMEQKKTSTMAQFWGIISKKTAEDILIHATQSRDEWDRDI